eukprot:CCRYP_001926-RB/>CCRYP_001926-RB protein AED:0.49 eAED:1.00 QI:0/0/0/1/0/0/2/0/110
MHRAGFASVTYFWSSSGEEELNSLVEDFDKASISFSCTDPPRNVKSDDESASLECFDNLRLSDVRVNPPVELDEAMEVENARKDALLNRKVDNITMADEKMVVCSFCIIK